MRLMDIILTLPSLLLALVIVAILGPGLINAMLAVAVVVLPHYVRLTRAAVITRSRRRTTSPRRRVAGAGRLRLMFSEVLPNCVAPLIVQATLGISTAILDAAALGFLGLGAQPPTPEWGTMLADAREFVLRAWWVVTFPGLAILITVLAFNLIGDGLRDALDPEAEALSERSWRCSRSTTCHVEFPIRRRGCCARSTASSLTLDEGEVLGIVGESGSGKSVDDAGGDGARRLSRAASRADRLRFDGRDLLTHVRPRARASSSARTSR